MLPPLLIEAARVQTAPGKVTELKAPLLSRKPWTIPAISVYRPTIWPVLLMSVARVTKPPGKSMVVKVGLAAGLPRSPGGRPVVPVWTSGNRSEARAVRVHHPDLVVVGRADSGLKRDRSAVGGPHDVTVRARVVSDVDGVRAVGVHHVD